MRVVIIGAVACGTKTACRLKRLRPDAEIVLIDKDEFISYGGCGMPYYLTEDVSHIDELRRTIFYVLRDEKFFQEIKGITTLTKTLAEEIDRKKKVVKVRYLESGKMEEIPYDKLVIATGSVPKIPPIPGVNLDGVFTLSNLHDAIKIKERLVSKKVERPLVIGAGFIGLEVVEAFGESWELPVTLLEYFPQVLPRFIDPFISRIIENHLKTKGVNVVLNARIKEIVGENGKVKGVRTENGFYPADLVLLATGVKPNTELAKKAGLFVSPNTEGIVVNERMQTSDPDIYAGGDCVEIKHLITGKGVVMPMGSLANRQGRVIATNIAGGKATFKGTVGAFILKCFDMAIGGCGLSLEIALSEGFKDATYALNIQHERAHFFSTGYSYYSLVFDKRTTKVLGFQTVGPFTDGTLARVHAISSILPSTPTIEEISSLELPYSPPFNTALDPIHVTSFIAENIIYERFKPIAWDEIIERLKKKDDKMLIIDVRNPNEVKDITQKYPNWINIPYQEARRKIKDLPRDKDLVVVCSVGARAYEAARWLINEGFKNVYVALGGIILPKSWGVEF
ncbi:MAG: pyridine nucleotide-disulfide oxidoreductase [Thermodesulfobacterium geofontis]|uniref:Pyridine nucleotide-disulfide oxidoreductase n=1 Tax=Thermodesulfobacterium geofontis TaxID=1295609 RepID=A0A2N7PPU3_9BACT|nr:MAG: pyridine nucleotide-disulfide oxidoreductase [Thermodesulfobacterium geofontis]